MKEHRRRHWAITRNHLHQCWQVQLAKPSRAGYEMAPPTMQNSGFKTRREAHERKQWLDRNHPASFVVV